MKLDATYLDLIGKYLSGEITPGDKVTLLAWVEEDAENQTFFEEMIQLWSVSGQYEKEAEEWKVDTDVAWNKVEQDLFPIRELLHDEPGLEGRVKWLPGVFMRVAAVALIVLVASYWLWTASEKDPMPVMVSVVTGPGQKTPLMLPDGSEVWLNENSELTYDSFFTKRQLNLVGEAFFDVVHIDNKPFIINSGETATTVLGTAFNVRAYPAEDRIEVTVERGKVKFQEKADKSDEELLEKGNRGIFVKEDKVVKKIIMPDFNASAWKTLKLNLNDIPFEQFEPTLERFFNIDIIVKNPCVLKQKFFGTYEDPSLDVLLETMAFSMDLDIKKEGKTITIDKQGDCN
ncbi:MAG: anti-sigma factor [Saprospiraceae bacterium]|nr:MAG: anti-sigma factor [Saprospiraceae bacterium]